MSFSHLPPVIGEALTARGYEALTPVQKAVTEAESHGRDLIVSAQTGSGKTVAFGLALADQLLSDLGGSPLSETPLVLVVAPTRELALQVSRELGWLFAGASLRIATCVGGMDASKERRNLRGGPAIVVGTPGRLRDHIERGALDLSGLIGVVLDEADEMLDMGFREDLEEILDATPETRRTLLFSATMPRPIERLAERYQRNALRLSLVGETRGHGDIAYQGVAVGPSEIENAVVNLLRFHEAETAICFCATRESVRRLHATLQNRGFGVVALSGEHSQSERNQALQALRDRRARVCVATDVAARGIDLPTLSLVIHVEIPRDAETLQHRSGRTGRAGKKGIAAIVVPHNRRRRVEGMLRGAQIEAEWIDAPTPEAIRKKDRTRLIENLTAPREIEEYDRELAADIMTRMAPEDIAAALVQAHRAEMPEPEELLANTPEAREKAKAERHRPGFEDVVWFRMDIGRRQNAEPRWILPLICRRGHITRNEIGAIRIGQHETWFQVPRPIAAKFADAVQRTASPDDEQDAIAIVEAPEGPRVEARENRKHGGGGKVHARPLNRKPGGGGGFRGKSGNGKPEGSGFRGKTSDSKSGGGFRGKSGEGKPGGGFRGKPGDNKPAGGKPFKKGKPFKGKGKPPKP
ncbi:MAG: DEAD/DEAH box helicase [Pseudomonadota bacterium]|jgi:ATP-dependent RNA helicase DeaD|uniref:DEAD/DEAH box helicase n=1 Tax=Qipengyuania pacifica TaxID=2860199 RepID=UPI000C1096DB|nr:DEAD/DEAH box helicase [Erythrobacter sp.]MEC7951600.1 DEAD/DEAH box helicase [Pseudomonadota bacterium]MEE2795327.1 DEAD/DEAH box helicase [Pseudomonadota bacterium]PHR01450.1 MAG: DEAD/DEAH box helicase [Erythrobacter sp.]|tara:strand:- start:326 stop:2242 length:1917 start_codon:yes stop_codon:yes gene_type:complete